MEKSWQQARVASLIEESKGMETELDVGEGMEFDQVVICLTMVTDGEEKNGN